MHVDATPWARGSLTPELKTGLRRAGRRADRIELSAESPKGPFRAAYAPSTGGGRVATGPTLELAIARAVLVETPQPMSGPALEASLMGATDEQIDEIERIVREARR
jgi:hypothetical protein